MNILNKVCGLICVIIAGSFTQSCSDNLEDHVKVGDSKLQQTLGQNIAADGNLSSFYTLLEETGYDDVLNSSSTYTVWVPTNEAMQAIGSGVLSSPESTLQFVKNHISLSRVSTDNIEDTLSVQMLTAKYQNFYSDNTIGSASIVQGNQYALNGVYHSIDDVLIPNPNLWEFIMSNTAPYEQNSAVEKLTTFDLFGDEENLMEMLDPSMEIDSDSITNEILRKGAYLKDEQKSFTYFLMENDGFMTESEKMKPYTQKPSQDSTDILAKYYVVRDMIFDKKYTPENLPDSLTSIHGVEVLVSQANIVGEPIELSNGIVYIMSRVDVPIQNKLQPVKVEGEFPNGFSEDDRGQYIFYREKADPSGEEFQDIEVRNHGVPQFSIYYDAENLYSTTYKVYWRAINDFEGSFWQHVRIGGHFEMDEFGNEYVENPIVEYEPQEVPPLNYDEVYVGEFKLEYAGDLDLISLIAENTGSSRWNPLTLDYLKLIPVVE